MAEQGLNQLRNSKMFIYSGTWNDNPLSAAAGVTMLNETTSGIPR